MKHFFSIVLFIAFICTNTVAQIKTGKIDSITDAWGTKASYIGEIKNGKPNGLGIAIYNSNFSARYAGYFVNGKYEGKGVMFYKDGRFTSGDWKGGKLHGQGTIGEKNKDDFFVGSMSNGVKNGPGTYIFSDNSFLKGNFKNDQYDGQCVYVNTAADVITDNTYSNGKKEGPGCQYEVKTKTLYEGIWKNGNWDKAATGVYSSFLKDKNFYGEKTETQIIMGITNNSSKLLEKTSFFCDVKNQKKYFGTYKDGYLEDGLIVNDSFRLVGTLDKTGLKGKCSYLKIGKYYDEGNYTNDYLFDSKALSIDLTKSSVYYGQTTEKSEFTGKAWFADNTNQLFSGDFVKGFISGNGWRLDKTGYRVEGKFENGYLITPTALYNDDGQPVPMNPKTVSEALTIICKTYPEAFYSIEAGDDYNTDYSFAEVTYKSLIQFPGSNNKDIIGSDYDYYNYHIANLLETSSFEEAKTKYKLICNQIKAANISLKKGAAPLKLKGEIAEPNKTNDYTISQFTFQDSVKNFEYFAASVFIRKNKSNKYEVLVICGDKYGMTEWDSK